MHRGPALYTIDTNIDVQIRHRSLTTSGAATRMAQRPAPNQVLRVTTRRGRILAALIAAIGIAGCSGDQFPQTTFRPVTEYGEALNSVFANTFFWTMGILVVVCALIIYTVFRYRERPGQPPPRQIHGSTKLELIWTTIPAIIVIFLAVPAVGTIFETQQRAPADALEIEVIGHQWWWEFRYPEYGVVTANEFFVPTGRSVHLRMHSADVVHSFWLPRLGGKRDLNPQPMTAEGENPRANHIVFTVNEPGEYRGQCAEFCGLSHAIMAVTAVAVSPAEFEAWATDMRDVPPAPAGTPAPTQAVPDSAIGADAGTQAAAGSAASQAGGAQVDPLIADGERLFMASTCVVCHSISGTTARGVMGPNLTAFGDRPMIGAGALPNTPENLERWIRDPRGVKAGALMPGTQVGAPAPTAPNGPLFPATGLSDEEVHAVAAYLSSLRR